MILILVDLLSRCPTKYFGNQSGKLKNQHKLISVMGLYQLDFNFNIIIGHKNKNKKNLSQEEYFYHGNQFLCFIQTLFTRTAALRIIKPNLQPIETEPCQTYCLDQSEITPDSGLITCDLVIKCIMPSFPCKIMEIQ